MNFRLVDAGWDAVLANAIHESPSDIRLVSPFIKKRTVERFLSNGRYGVVQVITRFRLDAFYNGVSDIAALRLLLQYGAVIRGVRNLHTKLYLFGQRRVIVTSANLTEAALLRNHEFGFESEDPGIIGDCRQYFDNMWGQAGRDLTYQDLERWERKIANHMVNGVHPTATSGLEDEGADVGFSLEPIVVPPLFEDATQAFVKFSGTSKYRADRSLSVFDEVDSTGCHWACTYPKNKRPRIVQDGALMFMGRLVKKQNDILIFGRAVGMHYKPGIDDASAYDIAKRPWKVDWPHYIRVYRAEFVAGSLANGVSLNKLMDDLGSDTFAATQEHALNGTGGTNPRRAFMRRPAVRLTATAMKELDMRLKAAFRQHGVLAPDVMQQLDWP